MTESQTPSASVLHQQWAKLEDEHHELAIAIDACRAWRADFLSMRERQARLLLEINSLVGEIQDAPATTTEDFLALMSRSNLISTSHATSRSTDRLTTR